MAAWPSRPYAMGSPECMVERDSIDKQAKK